MARAVTRSRDGATAGRIVARPTGRGARMSEIDARRIGPPPAQTRADGGRGARGAARVPRLRFMPAAGHRGAGA